MPLMEGEICRHCGRHRGVPCRNKRDMASHAADGDEACRAAMERGDDMNERERRAAALAAAEALEWLAGPGGGRETDKYKWGDLAAELKRLFIEEPPETRPKPAEPGERFQESDALVVCPACKSRFRQSELTLAGRR